MELNKENVKSNNYTNRILQFGEGNFLRAFADWMIYEMNKEIAFDAGITIIQPLENGLTHLLDKQDNLYTLFLQGVKNGEATREKMIIDVIQNSINPYHDYDSFIKTAKDKNIKFVISNTTESGIVYKKEAMKTDEIQDSFPAKLLSWLYVRYQYFEDKKDIGLIFLPCELIERNGQKLKEILNKISTDWNLESDFIKWLNYENIFCSTLVDRIVPGYPRDRIKEITNELGYKDNLVVEGELFHLWVIEGPDIVKEKFPADKAGLNVIFTNDLSKYRTRKVRVLNGAHTSMVPIGILYGTETVKETIEHGKVGSFIIDAMQKEIKSTIDLPKEELEAFVSDIIDRFKNPYIKHLLTSISLNSNSKFETRVLPTILDYIKINKELPKRLVFALASLIVFYKGEYKGKTFELKDDNTIIDRYKNAWEIFDGSKESVDKLTKEILGFSDIWKMDLNEIEGMHELTSEDVFMIMSDDMERCIDKMI